QPLLEVRELLLAAQRADDAIPVDAWEGRVVEGELGRDRHLAPFGRPRGGAGNPNILDVELEPDGAIAAAQGDEHGVAAAGCDARDRRGQRCAAAQATGER